MIVQMKKNVSNEEIKKLQDYLTEKGFGIKDASSSEIVLFGILGDTKSLDADQIKVFAGVENVTRISSPYKLASKAFRQERTIITLKNGVEIGGDEFVVMAGPCSVESEEQLTIIAEAVKASGSKILRGGVFKPRTSPYAFQGLGIEGLKMMRKVA